jgi:ribosomal protein S18 acetylase RimI-like enzyme
LHGETSAILRGETVRDYSSARRNFSRSLMGESFESAGGSALEFRVRRCDAGDATAISLVGQATILETYAGIAEGSDLYTYVTKDLGVETFRGLLASERACTWVVETDVGKCAVGYAMVQSGESADADSTIVLERFYLLYRFHGLGLGKRLIEEALAYARARRCRVMSLKVNAQNTRAIGFYERYGFKTVSEEPFRAGERDYRTLVMHLSL